MPKPGFFREFRGSGGTVQLLVLNRFLEDCGPMPRLQGETKRAVVQFRFRLQQAGQKRVGQLD